ncbi:MAG: hypothetical protein H6Q17_1430, partial [Bacteroidetes bacterium]|nr:hypothetical protein [Bacteroidota bacterium]
MKLVIFILSFILTVIVFPLCAQNKIGDNPQDIKPASLLELESVSKGLRLSRIQIDDVNSWTPMVGTPISGVLVFNDSGTASKGLYYWDIVKNQWVRVVNTAELTALVSASTTVSNAVTDNTLVTKVNGVSSLGEDIIKNNNLSIVNGELTSAVNGVVSPSGVHVLVSADNGLVQTNGNVQLGGALTKPTSILVSSGNTLSLLGLQSGDQSNDNLLVISPLTGEIRQIGVSLLSNIYTVDGSLTGPRKVTLNSNPLTFVGANNVSILSSGDLVAGGALSVAGTTTLNGVSILNGITTLNGVTTLNGATTHNALNTFNAMSQFNGSVVLNSNATVSANANITFATGVNQTTFKAGTQISNINYTLPTSAPTDGQVMISTSAGDLSWTTALKNVTIPISSLTAALKDNDIDNGAYQQIWSWNTLGTGTG